MNRNHYDWKRYWCPRSGKIDLSDNGFLVEPISSWRKAFSDVVPYSELDQYHFLGCLGEPGIGKTEELKSICKLKSEEAGCQVLKIDLERCRDGDFVRNAILKNEVFQKWILSTERLYLFLENLDRMPFPDHQFAEDLESAFSEVPIDRLFVRIACRTFDWSNLLELRMQNLFPSSEVFELAPLTRRDVEIAARQENIDSSKFISDVQDMDVVAFAATPVTLRFLLNKYVHGAVLPSSTVNLFRDGCLLLCAESNPELHEARAQKFSAHQIMVTASRIAAVLVFAQKFAIWDGVDDGTIPPEDIRLDELIGGTEMSDTSEIEISKDLILETLSCGLFSSRGAHRFAFAHQTYAEFLAAQYLIQRNSTESQIISLLVHSSDFEQHIVPQLTGVAAWLASLNQNILKFMIEHDPVALLLADLDRAGGEERQSIVHNILKIVEIGGLPLEVMSQKYSKLKHPLLSKQLEQVIMDDTASDMVKYEAFRIVAACNLRELTSHAIIIARNKDNAINVRVSAIRSLVLSDDRDIGQIVSLVESEQLEDLQDEIKGAALSVLYPDFIDTAKLFQSITPHKDDSLLGSYAYFLEYQLFDRLPLKDYPVALKWVKAQTKPIGERARAGYRMEAFCADIMWNAWKNVADHTVLESFAETAFARLVEHQLIVGGIHESEFNSNLEECCAIRRNFCLELLRLGTLSNYAAVDIAFHLMSVAQGEDFDWLLNLLNEIEDSKTRHIILDLVKNKYRFDRNAHLESIWIAKSHPDVKEAFQWLLEPIELDSEIAQKQRENYKKQLDWQKVEGKPIDPPAAKRILIRLVQAENMNPAFWDDLVTQLSLGADARENDSIDLTNSDIRTYAGWLESDDATRQRVVDAGFRFLTSEEIDFKLSESLSSSSLSSYAISAYKALLLLKNESPNSYELLSAHDWKRWLGTIILVQEQDENQKLQAEIAQDALNKVPENFILIVLERLKFEAKTFNWLPSARILQLINDERLESAILNEIQCNAFEPSIIAPLLKVLAQSKRTQAWVWDQINTANFRANDDLLIMATARFLDCWIFDRWDRFWTIIQENVGFGKRVFAEIANWDYPKSFLSKLSDDQLVNLYSWLRTQYPDEETVSANMVVRQTPQMMLWDFRSAIPNLLSQRNTLSACEALERILLEFPHLLGVKHMLKDSKERLRSRTWTPYQAQYILQLASNRRVRLVRSESELLAILLETLCELQSDLQGHQAQSRQVWSEPSIHWINKIFDVLTPKENRQKKLFVPKDEAAFSDFVSNYLTGKLVGQHGIILNREVQIRPNPGSKGERTDINVDAIAFPKESAIFERITVIIEVKGIWNEDIERAMKEQLIDEYLSSSTTKSGIYLVGYFNCAQWHTKDSRLQRAKKYTLDEITFLLKEQAMMYSSQGLNVHAVILDASLR